LKVEQAAVLCAANSGFNLIEAGAHRSYFTGIHDVQAVVEDLSMDAFRSRLKHYASV
jgi:hypothetical protein